MVDPERQRSPPDHGTSNRSTASARGLHRAHPRHRRRQGDGGVLPRVRVLGDLLAGSPRRTRRPQAGAAADPVPDGRDGSAAGTRIREECPCRRRRHGQAAPARRHGDLRRARATGPAVHDAGAAGRRAWQLWVIGRRSGGLEVHRGAAGSGRTADGRRARRGRRRLRPHVRQREHTARGAPRRVPEPPGQRRVRHCGRHGDEHGAAQPGRGDQCGPASDRSPQRDARRPDAVRPRP